MHQYAPGGPAHPSRPRLGHNTPLIEKHFVLQPTLYATPSTSLYLTLATISNTPRGGHFRPSLPRSTHMDYRISTIVCSSRATRRFLFPFLLYAPSGAAPDLPSESKVATRKDNRIRYSRFSVPQRVRRRRCPLQTRVL